MSEAEAAQHTISSEISAKAEQRDEQSISHERELDTSSPALQQANIDKLSVYVKNVDYKTQPEELEKLFKMCGKIVRITIMNDKFTGKPKGFCYIEFETAEAVEAALKLSGELLHERPISVAPKRYNIPNYTRCSRARKRNPRLNSTPY